MIEERCLTLKELGERLGLSVRHLQREIDRRELVVYRFGRAVRVAAKDVDSYLERHRRERVR